MGAIASPLEDQINNLLQEELPGLCATCTNRVGCIYRIQSKKIILQCELFEITKVANANRNSWEYKELKVNSHKGLCSNCWNTSHCHLPKAKGGVWHCEEYI